MKPERQNIGELEELILLVVGVLNDNAYGISVGEEIGRQTGRALTISAVHAVLHRLEKKGLVSSWMGGETKERGGRRKRFFRLTGIGREAITDIKQTREQLWNLIPGIS
jgi:PadR family transcriptional regulator PadR